MLIIPALILIIVLARFRPRALPWVYGAVVIYSVTWFPSQVGFRLHAPKCEGMPDLALAVYSLGNYGHIVLCAMFFVMTYIVVARTKHPFLWSTLAVAAMGALVELEEGLTGLHHCRTRDLIPDMTGALAGALIILMWHKRRLLGFARA